MNDLGMLGYAASAALYISVRVSVLMLMAPFFGSASIPVRIKAGATIAITALLAAQQGPRALPTDAWQLVCVIAGEALAGFCLAFSMQLVFDAAQFAGHIVGLQMGFSYASIVDPQTQAETSVMSVFHQTIALLIFLRLEVHQWLLRGLAKSFEYVPPGIMTFKESLATFLQTQISGMFLAGLQIAAPVLIATVLADFALALIGKASPQLPVLFVGMGVKAMLGMFVLGTSLLTWPSLFQAQFERAAHAAETMLSLAR